MRGHIIILPSHLDKVGDSIDGILHGDGWDGAVVLDEGALVRLLHVRLDHKRPRGSAVSAVALGVGDKGELVATPKSRLQVLKGAAAEQRALGDDRNSVTW